MKDYIVVVSELVEGGRLLVTDVVIAAPSANHIRWLILDNDLGTIESIKEF